MKARSNEQNHFEMLVLWRFVLLVLPFTFFLLLSAPCAGQKVSDVEVAGEEYEHLEGLFGLRMRVVRMKLGDELITLTEYLAPKGRPIPVDSRSNDRWFQHIAIIVS